MSRYDTDPVRYEVTSQTNSGNGYPVFFEAGEDKVGEEKDWHPISATLLLVQGGL